MKYIYNNPQFKIRRKVLRHTQTNVERLLWSKLRNKQIFGKKFFRQYSIGPYIADFYCSEKRLVIELDGSQHMKKDSAYCDKERSNYFYHQDIKIIRFWNNDVTNNITGVIEKIVEELK